MKNAVLLKKWIDAIGIENLYPNERSLICDDHFEKSCFYSGNNGYVGLKPNSFPTIFLISSSEGMIINFLKYKITRKKVQFTKI